MTMSDVVPVIKDYDQLRLTFDTEYKGMNQLIRVLVVDDHDVVRKGLRSLLTSKYGIEVVGEADNGIDAVIKAHDLQPDVILMDLVMPGNNGIGATQEIIHNQSALNIYDPTNGANSFGLILRTNKGIYTGPGT